MTINFKPCPKRALLARLRLWALSGMALLLAAAAAAAQAEEVERCKTNTTFKEEVVHFPVRWGLCVGCHRFENDKQPFTLRANIPDLCIGCHGMKMKDELGQTQPSIRSLFEAAGKPPEEGGMRLHKPFADGNCTCCHNPHTSSDRRMLDRPYSTENYNEYAPERYMCFKCHQERAFAEPRTLDATRFRNGNLNLHYRHVNRDKGRSCRLCHEHHASTYDALIRKGAAFGTKTIPILAFSRTETGGSCSPTCHFPVKYDRLEPELINIRVTPREGNDATAAELLEAVNLPKTGAPPWKANYPPKTGAAKTDAAKEDAAKEDAAKEDAAKEDAAKEDAAKEDAAKEGAAKEGAAKEGAAKEGAAKEDVAKEDVAKEDVAKEDAAKEDAAKEDAAKEDAAKEDAAKEDAPKEDAPKEDAPKEDAPKEDAPKEDAPKVDI